MKKILTIVCVLINSFCYSQRIVSEKYFHFENMCDQIEDSVSNVNRTLPKKEIDSILHEIIIENTKEYVNEISTTRFTYPFRIIMKDYATTPTITELKYAMKHYNITIEDISSGFAEQYPYKIYDSLMYNKIVEKYGDNIFKIIKLKSDSLIKIGKGYKRVKLKSKRNEETVIYNKLNRLGIYNANCSSSNTIKLSIDSNGKCKNIEVLKIGFNGRTTPTDCEMLKNKVNEKAKKLKWLKWEPAEFEGLPLESEKYIVIYKSKKIN